MQGGRGAKIRPEHHLLQSRSDATMKGSFSLLKDFTTPINQSRDGVNISQLHKLRKFVPYWGSLLKYIVQSLVSPKIRLVINHPHLREFDESVSSD